MKNIIATSISRAARKVVIAYLAVIFTSVVPVFGRASNSQQETQIQAFNGCNLPAINNLHVSGKTETSFSMSWNVVDGSAGYYLQIFRLNEDGSLATGAVQTQLVTATGATFNRLVPGKYRLVAAAVCEQDMRNLQLRNTPPTGDPTTTNIVVDEIVFLKTLQNTSNQASLRYLVMKDAPVSLGVYDMMGRQVVNVFNNKQLTTGVYDETLSTEGLQTGLYLIRLQVGKKVEVNKFFKM
jgi:hypothetical protein